MNASEKLRALDGAATPGPWHQVVGQPYNPDLLSIEKYDQNPEFKREEDAVALVLLRNALPQIVAVVEAAEALLPGPYVSDEGPALVPMERVVPFAAALAALDEALL